MSTVSPDSKELLNGTFWCQDYRPRRGRGRGIFFGDNPLHSIYLLLLAQLSIPSLLSTCLQFILSPLGESAFFAQMVVGIGLGPSSFGKGHSFVEKLYPIRGSYVNKTVSFFGLMIYTFLIGVKMDLSILKRSGKKAVAIGCGTFFVPIIINAIVALILKSKVDMAPRLKNSIVFISSIQSLSSYHVIASLLADLNILNSELGRLASSSSMISSSCAWTWTVITLSGMESSINRTNNLVWELLTVVCLIILVVFIIRPILLYMVRQTHEGKVVSESFVIYIFIMLLVVTFFSETIGQHFMFGSMLLGLAMPDGPPLGSAIVSKLESCVSCILLPSYFVYSGSLVNLSSIHWNTVEIVGILYVCCITGKILGVILPLLYNRMPLIDAIAMALIMSAQGITDVMVLQCAMLLERIDEDTYSVMSVSMILVTGIITPMVKILYKPSERYMHCKRRTIQHANFETQLRILACIHHQDNTPSMIKLFEISNPTLKTPIWFYVVHLIELTGRSTSILTYHKPGKPNPSHASSSSHIINAFRLYGENSREVSVLVDIYTDIAPYASMHYEICQLAVDKKCSMVIIPFHRMWTMHGTDEMPNPVRTVNRRFLQVAPCSVGVLIDRGTLSGTSIREDGSKYTIGMIFLEGSDDREALSYAMRMGEHSHVSLTVVRLIEPNNANNNKNNLSKKLDDSIIKEFKIAKMGQKNFFYREEVVSDIFETVRVIRAVENSFDLILVGKRHSIESHTEWIEFPELGYVGDMLASLDTSCVVSVLVVQQQMKEDNNHEDSLET